MEYISDITKLLPPTPIFGISSTQTIILYTQKYLPK